MPSAAPKNTAILLVDCPDSKGIVAAISAFLYAHGANILHADQHQEADLGLFLTRVEWELGDFDLDATRVGEAFAPIATRCARGWRSWSRATIIAWPTSCTVTAVASSPASCP
jgi:formyltetrahydrofolate deformylase